MKTFLPLVYIIDTKKVASRIIEVPPDLAAKPTTPEFKIIDLLDGEYELIDLGKIINAAKALKRRRISEYAIKDKRSKNIRLRAFSTKMTETKVRVDTERGDEAKLTSLRKAIKIIV